MLFYAISDAVLNTSVFPLLSTVFIGWMAFKTTQSNNESRRQSELAAIKVEEVRLQAKEAAVKVEEVRLQARDDAAIAGKKLDTIHTLVNSQMSIQLKAVAVLSRWKADQTDASEDIAAALQAESAWSEHERAQNRVDMRPVPVGRSGPTEVVIVNKPDDPGNVQIAPPHPPAE